MRNVLVVAASSKFRELVTALGQSEVGVRAISPSTDALARTVREAKADLVLIEDDPSHSPDGFAVVQACRDGGVRALLVVIGAEADADRVRTLLAAGAGGFVIWSRYTDPESDTTMHWEGTLGRGHRRDPTGRCEGDA